MDLIQILFVVAGVIAYWLNQRAREKAGEEPDYDGDGIPERRAQQREIAPTSRDGTDPAQAERLRRIQDDIRRKIAERRGEIAPPPMPPEVVIFQEPEQVFRAPVAQPPLRPDAFAHEDSDSLERQRKLSEQMERLEAQRREARRLAETTFSTQRQTAAAAALSPRAESGRRPSVTAELRDPRALRRALVLREVLNEPVALR